MATPAYMSITGTKQGLITAGAFTEDSVGNTYQEGHEDQVMVQGFNHEVIIPRDPQSGQPTGQRVHKPVVITKVFDKASPLLLAALTSGERLTKVEIQWYRTSAAGTQEHYYTTVLEDAIIVDIKDYMHNCQDPGNAHFTHLEDVHFTYRKITWTHEVSGTSGSDDWRSLWRFMDHRYRLAHRHSWQRQTCGTCRLVIEVLSRLGVVQHKYIRNRRPQSFLGRMRRSRQDSFPRISRRLLRKPLPAFLRT